MNKNGWGLRVELFYILIFLFCLVVATIGLNRLGFLGENNNALVKPDNSGSETYSYEPLETKVVNAAKKYYQDMYNGVGDDIVIVRVSTLQANGYLGELVDDKNKACSGYAKVITSSGGQQVYVSYIKCSRYTTTGYEGENDY